MFKRAHRHHGDAATSGMAAERPRAAADAGFSVTVYDLIASAERFHEPVRGLQTRELRSPDIFWRYFGASR